MPGESNQHLVRIHGRGHLLCLSRNLQSCLLEERFADVVIYGFDSRNVVDGQPQQIVRPLRANRAVLAAASPVLALLLTETVGDEEACLVFADYTHEDIGSLLQYVYTGEVLVSHNHETLCSLLRVLQIQPFGDPRKCDSEEEIQEFSIIVDNGNSKSPIHFPVETIDSEKAPSKRRGRPCRSIPAKATSLLKAELTLENPMNLTGHVPVWSSLLEKTAFKFDLLPPIGSGDCGTPAVADLPRLADRCGIYFDPQLFNYYRGLIRSLPPIRIFLHIESDESDSDEEDHIFSAEIMKVPSIVYEARRRKSGLIRRKSFTGSRIPVKTVCCVNGKNHLLLDGPLPAPWIDPSIMLIDYPPSPQEKPDDEGELSCQDSENEVAAELRRKGALLNTLSRLEKDHAKAKSMARKILRSAPSDPKTDDDVAGEEGDESASCSSRKRASETMAVCEICGKLVSASWIRVHFANHQGEKNFLCEHCGRCFASSNLLKSHVHYQHNSQLRLMQCNVCGKSFVKKSRLETHMRIHNDTRPYECAEPGCGKKFHTGGNLKKHALIHTGEKPHVCPVCDRGFSQATNLKLHMKTHQRPGAEQGTGSANASTSTRPRKPEAVYRCDFCPMTFSRVRHFNVHRARHTGETVTLPCQLCNEQFTTIQELKQHKLEKHPGTVHQCPLCEKSFFKKTAMQRHVAEWHDPSGARQVPHKPTFPCRQCNSIFTTSAARTVHERGHTGERPFVCTQCFKSFTSKYNFRQHLRMHSEERPYKCGVCDKAFRQPQHLRAHSYTHRTQDEPVPCPVCGKVFKNKILVMSHKRIHKQQASKASAAHQQEQEQTIDITEIMAQQEQQQPLEQTNEGSLQFVDSMGFVNILVLTEQDILNKLPKCD